MKLGRIVGTVVATRKDPKLEGLRLYMVEDLSLALKGKGAFVVAADVMGAGVGEVVLYCSGSAARQTQETEGRPVDAVVMAIVDSVDGPDGPIFEKFGATDVPSGKGSA